MQQVHRQFLYRAEIAVAVVCACLFALTLVDPQWIETLFDESPDDGDGSLERWILLGCTSIGTVLAGALAWRERRRLRTAP
ncbi:hypothetical protein [Variovorax rhizosphaerae]|uniref:ABC transporter permease n=1 Tax=Variovorax rhizosphaerae TaxID=1836200 RepID=A0ABU8WS13_9BURK